MAKRNTEVEEVEAIEEEAPKSRAKRDAVIVVWRGGSREYTRATHGEDFEALAAEFAEKKKGTLV